MRGPWDVGRQRRSRMPLPRCMCRGTTTSMRFRVEKSYVARPRTSVGSGSLDTLELDALSLTQGLIPRHLEEREVAEVDVAVISCDPAVALLVLPPTNGPGQSLRPFRHSRSVSIGGNSQTLARSARL